MSIKNIALLLKRYFVENSYREILFWSIITLIFTVFDHRDFVRLILYISGLILSINLYKELWNAPSGNNFFLIPATQAEKITVAILLNTVYYFIMTLMAYTLGHLLIMFVYHLILKISIPINWDIFIATKTIFLNGRTYYSTENEFWTILANFAFIQAISMVGSLYFRNNSTIKSIASLMGIALFLGIIQLGLMKLFLGDVNFTDAILYLNIIFNNQNMPIFVKYLVSIFGYLLIPYLWLLSYYRLTEKQV